MSSLTKEWELLAKQLEIKLPSQFLTLLAAGKKPGLNWRHLDAEEARQLKADLDIRFDYPGREWRGVPFARSTVSEDVACFDLTGSPDREAMVLPIRDWHGPRWEFDGKKKTFGQWLEHDSRGHLT